MSAEHPGPAPSGRRPRWVVLACLLSIVLGGLTLGMSLRMPPAGEATAGSEWHQATHPGDARLVPGLAVHPGPGVATLAAEIAPASGPATIRGLDSSPEAGASPVGAGFFPVAGSNRDP